MAFATTGCSSLFYFPRIQKHKFFEPEKVPLKYEDVEYQLDDGTGIHGWWFPSETTPAKGTVVFFHGNGENLTSHFMSLSWLPPAGYNYFIFDYPGYGVSEGEPTPKNTLETGKKALKWVHVNKDPSPLIVYAQSLGGNIGYRATLDMKDEVPIRNLILDSTFLSYRSIARQKAALSWITWLLQPVAWLVMTDAYAPKELDKRGNIPLLVIHGEADIVIPIVEGEKIFRASPEPKEFWRIPDGRHGDTFWRHEKVYQKKFLEYLDRYN